MKPWRTQSKTLMLDMGKFLKVEKHTIQLPDGRIFDNWPWVISPDYVLVLPVTNRNTFLLFEQVKYAVDGVTIAPVGGYIEPDENPLDAAKRELREEMGCEAMEWISLGNYASNGNHGGGRGHLYIALNVKEVGGKISDDLEEMKMIELQPNELESKLLDGHVKVQGWIALIGMGLLYLRRNGYLPAF